MLNYSTTDLNIFLAKAEHKLVSLGEELIRQTTYDAVENCLLDKIYLLTEIIDAINDSTSQEEIDTLVFFALDYYDLYTLAYSPFSVAPTLILSSGGGTGSGSGIVYWSDILDKPDTFTPTPHTHDDEDINIVLTGITEFQDRFGTTFTGTLQEFLIKLMSKYQAPSFYTFYQDKDTSFKLGQIIEGTMTFSWGINNPQNVKDATNSGSIIESESVLVDVSPFNLKNTSGKGFDIIDTDIEVVVGLPIDGYTKTIPGSVTFYLNGVASDNTSMNQPSTSLTWYSEIFYGNSTSTDVDETTIEGFQSTMTNSRGISFTISGSGYKYVFIPDNINQSGIKFIDPNSGFEIAMNTPLNKTIENQYGVPLDGKLYRTKNSLGSALTVVIQ